MSSPRITFTYAAPAGVIDPWWVRLEQENIPDDTATLADAATLLDTLYSIDPCVDDNEPAADPPAEEAAETIEITVDRLACQFDADGNIDVTLRVIRSRQDAPYRLALQGGRLLTTETIREPITKVVDIESGGSHTLDCPVIGGFTATWRGIVYGKAGRITPPAISRQGNTLVFGEEVERGSITATYLTEYDRCTLTILGVDGKPGECTARVFFHGLVDELELEIPEAADTIGSCTSRWTVGPLNYQIDCYRQVTISTRCQCTDKEISSRTYDESVDCPDSVVRCQGATTECRHLVGSVTVPEYVECADDKEIPGRPGTVYALSTPKYYEEVCCKKPSSPLPDCPERTTTHRGGLPLKGGAAQYYNIWGPKLRITPVSPPGGICGNWTIRQEIRPGRCCDGVPPLVWDSTVSPEVMSPNSVANIEVIGGAGLPLTWQVSGRGFQFGNQRTLLITPATRISLSALTTACGTAIITVTDNCSTCKGEIRCTAGTWVPVGGRLWRPVEVFNPPARGMFQFYQSAPLIVYNVGGDIFKGRYALAAIGDEYTVPGDNVPWVATYHSFFNGYYASCASHVGELVTDPIVGVFTIPAIHSERPLNSSPGYFCYPGQILRPLWYANNFGVFEWAC